RSSGGDVAVLCRSQESTDPGAVRERGPDAAECHGDRGPDRVQAGAKTVSRLYPAVAAVAMLTLAGCGESGKSPTLSPAGGVVLPGGQRLPNAQVTFTPTEPGLVANAQATGLTDETGHFTLTTGGKPGAAIGEHLVTVTEGPTPEDLRGEDAQEKMA